MWKVILFDLDGTLTDSGEGIMKSFAYAVKKGFGIHVEDYHTLKKYIGQPLAESFQEYANLDEEQAKEAVRLYRERYVPVGIYENRPYDGIPELLTELRAHGLTLAVASSKPTVMCEEVLRHFGLRQHFALVVGSELDGRRTNKADVIAEILRIFGMEDRKDEVVLVGDSPFDVKGAKKAGIDALGVAYGYGEREELEDLWPACIVDSVQELRNVLIGQALYGMPSSENFLANAVPAEDKGSEPTPANAVPADSVVLESAPANVGSTDDQGPASAPANAVPVDRRLPESAPTNAGWRGQPVPPVQYASPIPNGHPYDPRGSYSVPYGQPYSPRNEQPAPYDQPVPSQTGQAMPYDQVYPSQTGQAMPYVQAYPSQTGQPFSYSPAHYPQTSQPVPYGQALPYDRMTWPYAQMPREAYPENSAQEDAKPHWYGYRKSRDDNPFFAIWRVVWPPLAAFFIMELVGLILGILISAGAVFLHSGTVDPEAIERLIYSYTPQITIAADAMAFILVFFLFRADERKRKRLHWNDRILKKPSNWMIGLLIAIVAGALGCIFFNWLLSMFNVIALDPAYEEMEEKIMTYSDPAMMVIGTVIVAPIFEDMLFRGILYRRLRDYLNVPLAILLSAAAFGIFHGNIIQFLYASALGIIFAMLYEHFGKVLVPILCHLGANLTSELLNYLAPDIWSKGIEPVLAIIISGALLAVLMLLTLRKKNRVNRL